MRLTAVIQIGIFSGTRYGKLIARATKLAWLTFLCLLVCPRQSFAQDGGTAETAEKEPVAILELGAAPTWSVKDGSGSFGPTVAVEMTPIENWLEIEAGVTALFADHSTEWDTDLLFKKPWTLSREAELMVGVGPEWIHTRTFGVVSNSPGGEAALDFMYWPHGRHKFGLYLEPSYDYAFAQGHEQSVSITGGLLIAIP